MKVNIEAERVRHRMSKEALADKMGISLKTYYNWMNEETDIPSTKLREMAQMFGVSMEYLLEGAKNLADSGVEDFVICKHCGRRMLASDDYCQHCGKPKEKESFLQSH